MSNKFPIHHGITLAKGGYVSNLVVEVLATDPTELVFGRVWFNSAEKKMKFVCKDSSDNLVVRATATNEDLSSLVATVQAVDNRVTDLETRVNNLGSVFSYVGTVDGGATQAAAKDMSTLPKKVAGSYYKVVLAGYFKANDTATPIFANVGDGILFNEAGGLDKIDSSDATVSGTTDYITVTGSADSGFVVDVAQEMKDKIAAIGNIILGVGLNPDGTYSVLSTSNFLKTQTSVRLALEALDAQVQANTNDIITNANAIAAMKQSYSDNRFSFTSATAATEHIVSHGLNSTNVDYTVLCQREDGTWRNDFVGVDVVDANTIKVYAVEAINIKITVENVSGQI